MVKTVYFLLLVIVSHTIANSQDLEIFLIKDKIPVIQFPARQIKLGVSISHPVYFKLVRKENILQGSQFQRGLNIIKINSREFFQNPGIHEFILVTKKDQTQKKMKITITTRFPDSRETSIIPRTQSRNMKIEISGNQKRVYKKIGPINPLTHRYDNLDSINLLGIVSELIKKKKQKSLQKKLAKISSMAARCRQMTVAFYPEDNNNQRQPVYLSVSLHWENCPENITQKKE